MTTYAGPAKAIDPAATAQIYRVIESDDADSPFVYLDTASSRAGITGVSENLKLRKLAIIGLGGTGAICRFTRRFRFRGFHDRRWCAKRWNCLTAT